MLKHRNKAFRHRTNLFRDVGLTHSSGTKWYLISVEKRKHPESVCCGKPTNKPRFRRKLSELPKNLSEKVNSGCDRLHFVLSFVSLHRRIFKIRLLWLPCQNANRSILPAKAPSQTASNRSAGPMRADLHRTMLNLLRQSFGIMLARSSSLDLRYLIYKPANVILTELTGAIFKNPKNSAESPNTLEILGR